MLLKPFPFLTYSICKNVSFICINANCQERLNLICKFKLKKS